MDEFTTLIIGLIGAVAVILMIVTLLAVILHKRKQISTNKAARPSGSVHPIEKK